MFVSLSLSYAIYLMFLCLYAGLFFSGVFAYLILMHNKVLLDIHVVRSMLYANTGRPGVSVGNLETFWRWDVSANFGAVTRTGIFPHKKKKKKKCQTSGERLIR